MNIIKIIYYYELLITAMNYYIISTSSNYGVSTIKGMIRHGAFFSEITIFQSFMHFALIMYIHLRQTFLKSKFLRNTCL